MENILHITVQEPDALTVTHLFPNSLKENGTHLFIKSHEWDEIVIDLTTDIPKGCLKYVGTCTKKLTVNVPGEIDTHIVQLLSEVYPDLSGTIRKTFLFGGDVRALLP